MPGCVLGPFDIVGPLLPHGAFDVYRAADTRSNQAVTLKFLGDELSHDEVRRAQLLCDAERIGAFSHPHVASLLEIGEDEDQGGCTQYEDAGTTLQRYCRSVISARRAPSRYRGNSARRSLIFTGRVSLTATSVRSR